MVQFYRGMWKRRSYAPTLPIDLVGKGKQKLEWIDIYQKAFDDIKRIMIKKINLKQPKFAAVLFLDPVTILYEISEFSDQPSARNKQIFNSMWLACYPRPQNIIFDNRNEFKRDFLPLLKDFHITYIATTIKNSQTNDMILAIVY